MNSTITRALLEERSNETAFYPDWDLKVLGLVFQAKCTCMRGGGAQFMIKLSVFKKNIFIFLLTILCQFECFKYYFPTEIRIKIWLQLPNHPNCLRKQHPNSYTHLRMLCFSQIHPLYPVIYYVSPVINQCRLFLFQVYALTLCAIKYDGFFQNKTG